MKEENSIMDAYMSYTGGLNSSTMTEMFKQILDTSHETIDFNTNSLIYHKLQQLNKFVEEKIKESKPGIDDVIWMQTIEGKMGKMTLESAQFLIETNLRLAEASKEFKLDSTVAHNIGQVSKSLGFKFQESKVPTELDYSSLFQKFKYLTDYKRTPSQNSHIPIAEDPAIDNENIFG
mgnify:CR=1 FL=1|jgi:hypothetical protein